MLLSTVTIHILSVVFIATLFRSAFGFGESLASRNPERQLPLRPKVDLLANALLNMEEAGIDVALHVHDNVAAEVAEERAEILLPVFREAMLSVPNWTGGLPLAVSADISTRFG